MNPYIITKPFCSPHHVFTKGVVFLLRLQPYVLLSDQMLSQIVGNTFVLVFTFQEFARFLRVLGCYPMDTHV